METPEFFKGGAAAGGFQYNNNSPFNSEKTRFNAHDHFIVDELLDYPNDDGMVVGDEFINGTFDDTTTTTFTAAGTSTGSSSVVTGCVDNSSFLSANTTELPSSLFSVQGDVSCRNFTDGQFSTELCVPYDDMAELEWLSNCVEESFSIEDMQKLQLISGMKAQTNDVSQNHQVRPELNRATSTTTIFRPEIAVPAKARSKRSRAYPCNWTTRLLAVSSGPPTTPTMSSSSESNVIDKTKMSQKKKEVMYENDSEGRKCYHCATDKTPQWRTGPMGPKTLCNACGVRYKSGRLVPEYRPAASPTFVLTKHSNSHRKVVELRRQNEFIRNQQHQHQQLLHQNMMFDASNGGDFLIHHHLGTDFRQLI